MHDVDRRRFIARGAALALGAGLPGSALGQAKAGRKLGTCGPPPRKNPTRQTSAEGMPPLPLPAVPLRRRETKDEPATPLLFAKMVYGTMRDLQNRSRHIDNLVRHLRPAHGLVFLRQQN